MLVSGRSDQNNRTLVMTRSKMGNFFSNQGDIAPWKIGQPHQFFNSSELLSPAYLYLSFRKIWSKLKELWWWQAFFHCKSIETCGCYTNQSFYSISIKSICHQSLTRGMLQMRNDWDQPAGCRDMTGQNCWGMDGLPYYKTLSPPPSWS